MIFLLCLLLSASISWATPSATQFFAKLEQHLRSLKTLELRYSALGEAVEGNIEGQMLWQGSDKFLHDTPEWTVCVEGMAEWRHLKKQNTLIRESVKEEKAWLPENILFSLKQDVKPIDLEILVNGDYKLTLKSKNEQVEGNMIMIFPAESVKPNSIAFNSAGEASVEYKITEWKENGKINDSLFVPPQVPTENIIDFRTAAGDR